MAMVVERINIIHVCVICSLIARGRTWATGLKILKYEGSAETTCQQRTRSTCSITVMVQGT